MDKEAIEELNKMRAAEKLRQKQLRKDILKQDEEDENDDEGDSYDADGSLSRQEAGGL